MPRDVPLVFVWDDQRFALVYEHEGIAAFSYEDFEKGGLEVVPWTPGPIEPTEP